MAIISNGTTIASGGSVQGSGANLTNLPSSAPTTSQVLTATASASAGAVGSYAFLRNGTASDLSAGGTQSGSSLYYGSNHDNFYESSGTVGGTWRILGRCRRDNTSNSGKGTLFLRIS